MHDPAYPVVMKKSTTKWLSLACGVVGLIIWTVPGTFYWIQGSLSVARILVLGLSGSVFWLLAGALISQSSPGVRRLAVVISLLGLAFWIVPALLFIRHPSLGVKAYQLVWACAFLVGLALVIGSILKGNRHSI